MEQNYDLLHLSNVVLTPHIAGSTEACLARTAQEVANQVLGVLDGRQPQHLVNPNVWARRRTQ
jgi:D-3-phosphoglycerate dehydrogenase